MLSREKSAVATDCIGPTDAKGDGSVCLLSMYVWLGIGPVRDTAYKKVSKSNVSWHRHRSTGHLHHVLSHTPNPPPSPGPDPAVCASDCVPPKARAPAQGQALAPGWAHAADGSAAGSLQG